MLRGKQDAVALGATFGIITLLVFGTLVGNTAPIVTPVNATQEEPQPPLILTMNPARKTTTPRVTQRKPTASTSQSDQSITKTVSADTSVPTQIAPEPRPPSNSPIQKTVVENGTDSDKQPKHVKLNKKQKKKLAKQAKKEKKKQKKQLKKLVKAWKKRQRTLAEL